MKEKDIRRLEPKYTGNTRRLTEGEAAGIVNDPENKTELDEDDELEMSTDLFSFIDLAGSDGYNRTDND